MFHVGQREFKSPKDVILSGGVVLNDFVLQRVVLSGSALQCVVMSFV